MALEMPLEAALRMAREFSGLTVVQISIAAGLTPGQVVEFEIGESHLTPDELTALARSIRYAVEVRCARLRKQRLREREKQRLACERLVEHENNAASARLYGQRVQALVRARAVRASPRAEQIRLPERIENAAGDVVAASLP